MSTILPPSSAAERSGQQTNETRQTETEELMPPPPPPMADKSDRRGSGVKSFEIDGQSSSARSNSNNDSGYSAARGRASDGNVVGGVSQLNKNLRSIVMSKTTFRMFLGFNPDRIDGDFLQKLFNKEELSDLNFWKNIPLGLLSVPAGGTTIEKQITDNMVKVLDNTLQAEVTKSEGKKMIVIGEGNLPRDEDKSQKGNNPSLDITIGTNDNRLLAFVEVGLIASFKGQDAKFENIDKLFWEKVDQAHNYLKLLYLNRGKVWKRKGKETEIRFEVPMAGSILFAVLVFDRLKTMGRMAIFSAERKGESTCFRVSLMWRYESRINGFAELDEAYGAFINAVDKLRRVQEVDTNNVSSWEYLGPDCSKVTIDDGDSFVLRAYDNRVRETPRSPFLYKNYDKLKNDTEHVVKVVDGCESDERDVLEFGQVSGEEALSMIFSAGTDSKRGQVEVISVPFYQGSHVCKSVQQAKNVVNWMAELHAAGFVHGDIRAFNLVFSPNSESRPIDFDFGGKKQTVKFPPGYKTGLEDVSRCGKDLQPILPKHDLFALRDVLLNKHMFDDDMFYSDDGDLSIEKMRKTHTYNKLVREMKKTKSMKELTELFEELATICPDMKMSVNPNTSYAELVDAPDSFPKMEARTATAPATASGNLPLATRGTPYGAQHTPVFMPVITSNRNAVKRPMAPTPASVVPKKSRMSRKENTPLK